jgi:hypothetical protein
MGQIPPSSAGALLVTSPPPLPPPPLPFLLHEALLHMLKIFNEDMRLAHLNTPGLPRHHIVACVLLGSKYATRLRTGILSAVP